jgi:hypothetical protein
LRWSSSPSLVSNSRFQTAGFKQPVSNSQVSSAVFSQRAQYHHTAGREGYDGGQSSDQHHSRAQMENVSKHSPHGEHNSQQIKPHRTSLGKCRSIRAQLGIQPPLQQQRRNSNRSHHYQRHRAQESSARGVKDHERQSRQQQSCRNDCRAARPTWGDGIRTLFRHDMNYGSQDTEVKTKFRLQIYTGTGAGFSNEAEAVTATALLVQRRSAHPRQPFRLQRSAVIDRIEDEFDAG